MIIRITSAFTGPGWPDTFDGPAFHAAPRQYEDEEIDGYVAEEPVLNVNKLEGWLNAMDQCPAQCHLDKDEIKRPGCSEHWSGSIEAGRKPYEMRRKEIMRFMAIRAERRALREEELQYAREQVKQVPKSVKSAMDQKITKYTYLNRCPG